MEEKITAFVARDEDNLLYLYNTKDACDVYKNERDGMWNTIIPLNGYREISGDAFPSVKWEDKEPTEVEITIKRK